MQKDRRGREDDKGRKKMERMGGNTNEEKRGTRKGD